MTLALSVPQLALAVAAGGLTTLSPCVFPLLPLVLGGALQGHRLAPVAMGLGMTSAFALIGMALGALGPALGLDGDSVRTAGAVLLLAFAVVILVPSLGARFSQWLLPLAGAAQAASSRWDGRSLGSAAALGAVLGLVWSPCSGPLLGSALTLVASEGGVARGGVVLALFGLGAALPLVGVAYLSRQAFVKVRDAMLSRMSRVRVGFAILLGGMGLAILAGWDKQFEALILQALPDAWVNLTVGL
jgi:cytochrome c biogenesis protein CcdA